MILFTVSVMVCNVTFNISSVISWQSVLLVEETRSPGETTDVSKVTDKLDHVMFYRAHIAMNGIRTHSFSGDMH
jgi:hypothetical protein